MSMDLKERREAREMERAEALERLFVLLESSGMEIADRNGNTDSQGEASLMARLSNARAHYALATGSGLTRVGAGIFVRRTRN